jgi:hypothetical protein
MRQHIREANEIFAELAHRTGRSLFIGFLCECDDPNCFEAVPLTLDAYEGVCRSGHAVIVRSHRREARRASPASIAA